MASCEPISKKRYEKRDMCAETSREFLVEQKFLPSTFRLKQAVFYDIESFAQKNIAPESKQANTHVLSTQKMVTISVTANFGNNPRTVVFARNSFEKDDYIRVLREFTVHLKKLQCELVKEIPEVTEGIDKISDILFDESND